MRKSGLIAAAIASGLLVSAASAGTESATGVLNLVSITGSGASAKFSYSITLKDTGTTDIGTFWYAWIPPDNVYDFLKSKPTAEVNPTGWTANLEGLDNGSDDNSIQWVSSTNPLTPGSSLTFGYTTPDNPKTVTGPASFGFPTGYSYVYIAGPETDPGTLVNVAVGAIPEPSTFGLLSLAAGTVLTLRRRRHETVVA